MVAGARVGVVVAGGALAGSSSGDEAAVSNAAVTMIRSRAEYSGWHDVSVRIGSSDGARTLVSDGLTIWVPVTR